MMQSHDHSKQQQTPARKVSSYANRKPEIRITSIPSSTIAKCLAEHPKISVKPQISKTDSSHIKPIRPVVTPKHDINFAGQFRTEFNGNQSNKPTSSTGTKTATYQTSKYASARGTGPTTPKVPTHPVPLSGAQNSGALTAKLLNSVNFPQQQATIKVGTTPRLANQAQTQLSVGKQQSVSGWQGSNTILSAQPQKQLPISNTPVPVKLVGTFKMVQVQFDGKTEDKLLNPKDSLTKIRQYLTSSKMLASAPFEFLFDDSPIEESDELETALEEILVLGSTLRLKLGVRQQDLTTKSQATASTAKESPPHSSTQRSSRPTKLPVNSAKLLRSEQNLSIYSYPQIMPRSLTPQEQAAAKYVLVVGETGAGKSTLLNMLANYFLEVEHSDEFRYQIIAETLHSNQAVSQTQSVQAYTFKPSSRCNSPVVLIDTPGYGDTRGIEQDRKTDQMIREFVKNRLPRVDLVLFATKATTIRFTEVQTYVARKTEELLEATKSNSTRICFAFTFCDSAEPQVVREMSKSNQQMQTFVKRLGPNWFLKFNNSTLYRSHEPSNQFSQLYWNMAYAGCWELVSILQSPPQATLPSLSPTQRIEFERVAQALEALSRVPSCREELEQRLKVAACNSTLHTIQNLIGLFRPAIV